MEVELLAYTPMPEMLCGEAAGTCYRSDGEKALKAAMSGGHESVLEHAAFTFRISGVSRVLLAQLTRHRIVSFSVESQRYTNSKDNPVHLPDSLYESQLHVDVLNVVTRAVSLYEELVRQGVPKEDARYILPQGITTNLVLTANARELRHIFALRCCNRAQTEIRELAWRMLKLCEEAAPELFRDAGPGCVRGKCPEKKPCGNPYVTDRSAPEWTPVVTRPPKSGFYAVKAKSFSGEIVFGKRFFIAESGNWYDETGIKNTVTYWKEWSDAEALLTNDDEGDDRK